MHKDMFCFQCQEAANATGCTRVGVCGKSPELAALQDLLVYLTKGVSAITTRLRSAGIDIERDISEMVTKNLFMTITNANFDEARMMQAIASTMSARDALLLRCKDRSTLPDASVWQGDAAAIRAKSRAPEVGVLAAEDADIRSLRELVIYGLKGLSAYLRHANVLGYHKENIDAFLQNALSKTLDDSMTAEEYVDLVLETGKYGVAGMAMLDEANTATYGHPEVTSVPIGAGDRPGILVSGHDLNDLHALLEQSAGEGVDIYTHSEMLPAHAYPVLKKYPHFRGNYGNAWWKQKQEFASFHGPILMTTNCIVPPAENVRNRIWTTGAAGFPGCRHIEGDVGAQKDFSAIIEQAKTCAPPEEMESGNLTIGFAHHQVFSLADDLVEAVRSGAIRKFVVMAGCDGRMPSRAYYEEFARRLPGDVIILTAGCAKYRYNKLGLGDINGIPRVIDAGQCNDSYSLALIALKFKEIFGVEDINELPIVYNIAWYEQKAVIVLLALLYLGIKNIHLGPTLPAFLSPNITNVLVDTFGIAGIGSVEDDLRCIS